MAVISPLPVPKAQRGDVYVTGELAARACGAPDHEGEKHALQDLANCMIDSPAEVLPRLVRTAMRLTGGSSSGLSLFEPDEGDGVFRWACLHGTLAPFESALTPRNDSPCGVTLDQNAPVLAQHPEIIYDWISDENIIVPEVLLVPLHVTAEEPLGTLWIVAPETGHFNANHSRLAADLAKFAGIAIRMTRGEERLRTELEQQQLLAKEMSHRLKNLFAITDGMIHGSARGAETTGQMASALSGRLHALARAHALVQRDVMAISDVRRADLHELLTAIVQVHEYGGETRFAIEGPVVECGDHATNALALVIHELGTNAAKYGALTADSGQVSIRWRAEADRVVLEWRETGGPAVTGAPATSGFGNRLVARTIEQQLGGTISYDWRDTGLEVAIDIPADQLAR